MMRFPTRPAHAPTGPTAALSILVPVLALALLLAFAGPVTAQEREQEEEPVQDGFFMDTVDVNVINVDVYVTDDDGNPVTGLTAADFEVLENDKVMAITNFYAVQDNRVTARTGSSPAQVPSGEPAAVEEETVGEPLPEDERLNLVLFIDNLNIRPFNRRRVLQDLRAFLREQLQEGDRVMLVTYDRSLDIVRNFTGAPESIIDALFELDEVSGLGVHIDSQRRDLMERIRESRTPGEAIMWARNYAEQTRSDLHFTIDAIKEITTSLAGVPGRKAMVYVSDGIPMIAGEDLFHLAESRFPGNGALSELLEFDASRRFRELAAQANANRVSFYTIDAAGLRVYTSGTVENMSADTAGIGTFVDSVNIQNLQSPIQFLAEETGGKAVINRNRFGEPLERIANDFRNYYSLGYTPAHSGDGRYYEIEVRLKDPELDDEYDVRHRTGYRDKTPQAQMNDGVLAALRFPYMSNPLDVRLEVGQGEPQGRGRYLVPIDIEVPIGRLVLVPRGEAGEYVARARLFLAAMDEEGGMSEIQEVPLPITIPENEVEQARGQLYRYSIQLLMRDGRQKVAVGVRDDITATNSFASRTLTVGRRGR